MEISAKEARSKLSFLLKKAEEGSEIVIARRGKKVARLIAVEDRVKWLPTLRSFRASVKGIQKRGNWIGDSSVFSSKKLLDVGPRST